MTKTVDVAISVYGKPYQTAVTLMSLLKYSGQHIAKIYFIMEKKQPHNSNFDPLLGKLGKIAEVHRPFFFLWYYPMKHLKFMLRADKFRHSVRYQYAWEKSDKKYLFITHNDMLYSADIIKYYLDNIENNMGIGTVGMCWNCSAYYAKLCDGDRYLSFRPTPEEYAEIIVNYPHPRNKINSRFLNKNKPWPLPECGLTNGPA